MDDHYQTLGIGKNASADEIKKAYRKLASQHHPDKGGDTATFQKIQGAYETLSDPAKRSEYDNPQPQFNGVQFGGGVPPGMEDLFAQMFGGNNPFFGHGFRQQQRNNNVQMQMNITMEESYYGKEIITDIQLPSGIKTVEIKIPAGIASGQTLRVSGAGESLYRNAPPGDLLIQINVLNHHRFTRQGDDLHSDLHLSVWEAMVGVERDFICIDGTQLKVSVPSGIQFGQSIRLIGRGMPMLHQNHFKGNQFLNVRIEIPRALTDQQKDLVRQFIN
jgi:DnaJ-class molecular chaperone